MPSPPLFKGGCGNDDRSVAETGDALFRFAVWCVLVSVALVLGFALGELIR